MDEMQLLKTNPKALLEYYLGVLQSGGQLTPEQLIKLEYVTRHGD